MSAAAPELAEPHTPAAPIAPSTSGPRIADGTPLPFGEHTFTFGQEAVELTDSRPLLGDLNALKARLETDGYLFIRGFHPRELAEAAARRTLEAIRAQSGLAPDSPLEAGRCATPARNFSFFRDVAVAHTPEVLAAVNGSHCLDFFRKLLGGPVLTFDKRWLRAMGPGGCNHFHYDSAYVGRGTTRRYTLWSAFTDIGLENGPLAICLKSHRHQRLIETYGATDMDRDLTDAAFSSDPKELVDNFGFQLATAHFEPGDAILFGLHLMHSSIPNRSDTYRISIDTRYQLAGEPSDERFHGPDGKWLGNFYNKGVEYRPMRELRAEWGL